MTTWLIRKTGANTNGGTSQSVLATATDGVTNAATNTITSVSGLFNAGMVGQGIYISQGTSLRTITAYTSATSVTYSGANLGVHTGLTYNVGGSWLTVNNALVSTNSVAAGDLIYIGAGVYRETVANALTGSVLSTTYNGTGGASLTTIGSVLTLTSVTGLIAPPTGYYAQGSVVTSVGVVGFTWTGLSGSTLTGVVFQVNNTVTSSATVASSAVLTASIPTFIIGDVDGAVTSDAGQVTVTAWTTSDSAVPSSTVLLACAAHTNLTFSLITFIGGSNTSVITSTAATSTANLTFIDCTINQMYFVTSALAMKFVSSTTGLALGITIDRCFIFCSGGACVEISLTTTATGSTDFDSLCVIRNCLMTPGSNYAVVTLATGTAANKGGGVRMYNSTVLAAIYDGSFQTATASELSTAFPCEVHNNFLNGGIGAATAGQIVGSYNNIYAANPESNYTYGTGDVSNSTGTTTYRAPLVELGQSLKWAGVTRQFMAPDGSASPLLGFGNSTGAPLVDWANRNRPSGGKSASNSVGYSELHDFAIQDTTTYPVGSTSSGKLVGPGDQYLYIPVDAVSTVITIQIEMSSGYGGTNYAACTLHANGELGVAAQTETCSSTTGSFQTLTFSAITPTKQGWVTLQIDSFDTSGTADVWFAALT